jgi:hypothetical protein
MFSAQLEKALNLINYERGDQKGKASPPGTRTEYAKRVAGVMLPETAETVFAELLALRGGWLFKDEADLQEALAARFDKPLMWRHWHDKTGVKEGRHDG